MTERVLTGVGAQLKQARESAGLAVDEVAQRLKLMPHQIESLEREHFDRLPGPAIARGMVRNYARLLKLDPEPLVARLAPQAQKAPDRQQLAGRHRQQAAPSATESRRSTLLYVGFSLAVLALAGFVAYEWKQQKAAPVEPQLAPVVVQKPAEEPAKPVEEPVVREEPQVAVAKPEPPVKPQSGIAAESGAAPGTHRLVLRMEEDAWLEVRDGAGRSLVSSIQPAGSERSVRGQPPFQLVIGNAAHVQLIYDGKTVKLKPYMRGEVARLTLK